MEANQKLLHHPFWRASNPLYMNLVRISEAFPRELNPFADDGVVIKAAGVPGDTPNSKWAMAREGILHGIEQGLIGPDTTVVEATSGNTGFNMAVACNALGLRFVPVMSGDVPQDKINSIRTLGRHIQLRLHFDPDETTVECARRLGAQDGWHNPDQYAGSWNYEAHCKYLARQLFRKTKVSILVIPSGTMGTYLGHEMYVRNNRLSVAVVPVLCAEDEEVPGARTLRSVEKDIRHPWKGFVREEDIQFSRRHESFLLSFLTWPYVLQGLGPSFGLAFAGALRFLQKHKRDGTLMSFDHREDGKIHVVVFGPDDYRPYTSLYLGEPKKKELSAKVPPADLMSILA